MSEQEKDWSDADWLRVLFNPPTNYGYRFDAKAVERAFRIAQQLEENSKLRQQLAASQAERDAAIIAEGKATYTLGAMAQRLSCEEGDEVEAVERLLAREAELRAWKESARAALAKVEQLKGG